VRYFGGKFGHASSWCYTGCFYLVPPLGARRAHFPREPVILGFAQLPRHLPNTRGCSYNDVRPRKYIIQANRIGVNVGDLMFLIARMLCAACSPTHHYIPDVKVTHATTAEDVGLRVELPGVLAVPNQQGRCNGPQPLSVPMAKCRNI